MTIRTVTDDAGVVAALAAHVAGDTIVFSGSAFSLVSITSKSDLILTSENSAGKIPSIKFNGTCNNIDFSGLNIQMTGWPATYTACVQFETGTFTGFQFRNGTTMRHGYGASLVDFDMEDETYPEYVRVDNVQTASTSSTTYALSWQDPARTSGQLYFFNRGATDVYVKLGGAGVVATASDTLVVAGSYTRILGRNPTVDTHLAVIAVSGTPEINARAEIGMSEYVCNAFSAFGNSVIPDLEIYDCVFSDLKNGVKSVGGQTDYVYVYDNNFYRIYQDIIALSPRPGATVITGRNRYDLPFARSGTAEDLDGDAGDPHGDIVQLFGNNTGTIGPVYSAGNRPRNPGRRAGVTSQGNFWTDNIFTPGYDLLFSISDALVTGSQNGQAMGDVNSPARNAFIYGTTLIDVDDLVTGSHSVRSYTTLGESDGVFIEKSIVCNLIASAGYIYNNETLLLGSASSPAAVFPDIADLITADSRAEIELALTTAAEGAGLGAVATANAVDWITTDPTQIIIWDNVPSGVLWDDVTQAAVSSVYEFPLRRILNRKASQTVVPGSGVEWRCVDTDGTTEVQDWTDASGTIEPSQYVQMRVTTSSDPITSVTATLTINGFDVVSSVTTELVLVNPWRTNGAVFYDPSNVPANTSVLEFEASIMMNTLPPATTVYVFAQEASARLEIITGTSVVRVSGIKDSAGTTVLATGTYEAIEYPAILNLKIDLPNSLATLSLNNVVVATYTLAANSGLFVTNRELAFGANGNAGTNGFPSNTDIGYFKCWKTVSGVRTLHKEISIANQGSIAAINADPWTHGTVIASPDTTAPVVSGVTVESTGHDSLEFYFSTNEGNGTAYWFASTSATPPSATDLIAGTGSVAYGSVTVSASGLQATIPVSGLTPETVYYVYVMQDDAASNRSGIDSDNTETGTTPPPTWQDIAASSADTLTISNVQESDYGRQFRRKIVGLTTRYSNVVEIKEPI